MLAAVATAHAGQGAPSPVVLQVSSVAPGTNPQLSALVDEVRRQADAFVFLCGGASRMAEAQQRQLLSMFRGLQLLAAGRRIAVGDGGTQAGIMEASGRARRESGNAFLLLGVTPANEIPPRGSTAIDPNHSHIVAVTNPSAPPRDSWGSETETMYWLFNTLSAGRPSVTIVANGGGIVLAEVAANVKAGRRMLLIKGSGRAADALISLLERTTPTDDEVLQLRGRAEAAGLVRRPELFQIVPMASGAEGLRDALANALGSTR